MRTEMRCFAVVSLVSLLLTVVRGTEDRRPPPPKLGFLGPALCDPAKKCAAGSCGYLAKTSTNTCCLQCDSTVKTPTTCEASCKPENAPADAKAEDPMKLRCAKECSTTGCKRDICGAPKCRGTKCCLALSTCTKDKVYFDSECCLACAPSSGSAPANRTDCGSNKFRMDCSSGNCKIVKQAPPERTMKDMKCGEAVKAALNTMKTTITAEVNGNVTGNATFDKMKESSKKMLDVVMAAAAKVETVLLKEPDNGCKAGIACMLKITKATYDASNKIIAAVSRNEDLQKALLAKGDVIKNMGGIEKSCYNAPPKPKCDAVGKINIVEEITSLTDASGQKCADDATFKTLIGKLGVSFIKLNEEDFEPVDPRDFDINCEAVKNLCYIKFVMKMASKSARCGSRGIESSFRNRICSGLSNPKCQPASFRKQDADVSLRACCPKSLLSQIPSAILKAAMDSKPLGGYSCPSPIGGMKDLLKLEFNDKTTLADIKSNAKYMAPRDLINLKKTDLCAMSGVDLKAFMESLETTSLETTNMAKGKKDLRAKCNALRKKCGADMFKSANLDNLKGCSAFLPPAAVNDLTFAQLKKLNLDTAGGNAKNNRAEFAIIREKFKKEFASKKISTKADLEAVMGMASALSADDMAKFDVAALVTADADTVRKMKWKGAAAKTVISELKKQNKLKSVTDFSNMKDALNTKMLKEMDASTPDAKNTMRNMAKALNPRKNKAQMRSIRKKLMTKKMGEMSSSDVESIDPQVFTSMTSYESKQLSGTMVEAMMAKLAVVAEDMDKGAGVSLLNSTLAKFNNKADMPSTTTSVVAPFAAFLKKEDLDSFVSENLAALKNDLLPAIRAKSAMQSLALDGKQCSTWLQLHKKHFVDTVTAAEKDISQEASITKDRLLACAACCYTEADVAKMDEEAAKQQMANMKAAHCSKSASEKLLIALVKRFCTLVKDAELLLADLGCLSVYLNDAGADCAWTKVKDCGTQYGFAMDSCSEEAAEVKEMREEAGYSSEVTNEVATLDAKMVTATTAALASCPGILPSTAATKATRRRRATTAMTCDDVKALKTGAAALTADQLAAITSAEFVKCYATFGAIDTAWGTAKCAKLSDHLTAGADAVVPASGSIKEANMENLGCLAQCLSTAEADSKLAFTNTNQLSVIGQCSRFPADKRGGVVAAFVKTKLSANAASFTADDVTALGSMTCGMPFADVAKINADVVLDNIDKIGKAGPCDDAVMTNFINRLKATSTLGTNVTTWAPSYLISTGNMLGGLAEGDIKGLTKEQVSAITPSQISNMPTNKLKYFSADQFSAMGASQVQAITVAQAAELSSEQKEAMNMSTENDIKGSGDGANALFLSLPLFIGVFIILFV